MRHQNFLQKLLAVVVLISFVVGCSTPSPIHDIADHLEELDAEEKFSGVVLISKDGEAVLERAYGIANRNYDVPNQIDTKFNLGSMNKMFTAVAIMQLAEQGKLSVDDKIIKHFPEYPNQDVAESVTIHQLLTHTSGLGDIFNQEYRNTSKDLFKEHNDFLPLFVDHPLLFEPGTRGAYSNAGYIVLGIIIEETTEQSYYDYINENIYEQCEMMDSGSFEADRIVPNIAVGYAGNLRNYSDLSSNFYLLPFKGISAGGGYSTARDMLKFSNCLVNHQLLSPESTKILTEDKVTLQSPVPDVEGKYSYGFVIDMVNNHRIIGHSGGLPGACSNLDIFTDLGYTVVILSNSTHDCVRVKIKIREILLDQ
jgi:D-alanyl-D-alanine carboxypeptidase